MANRKGLGVSKKYAKGMVHETATGRFVILDRYADEDDEKSIPMLEYKWLTGDREGKVETNREMNIAASIHKYLASRGRPTIMSESPKTIEDEISFVEKIDKTYDIVSTLVDHLEQDEVKMAKINQTLNIVTGFTEVIDVAAGKVMENSRTLLARTEQMMNDHIAQAHDMISKLETMVLNQQEIIVQLTEKMQEVFHGSTLAEKQQEQLTMQQGIMNKLIEKL